MKKILLSVMLAGMMICGVSASDDTGVNWGEKIALYIPNRIVDAFDCFSVNVGVGPTICANLMATRFINVGGSWGDVTYTLYKDYNRQYGGGIQQGWKEGREIEYARTRIVVASRAAGVDAYDTPFTDVNDDEGIVEDSRLAKALGFSGKASISPRHVDVINEVFSPTLAEIEYAYEVLDAIELAKKQGKGAIALRGKMIDAPIVARAERTIAAAKELGLDRGEGNE